MEIGIVTRDHTGMNLHLIVGTPAILDGELVIKVKGTGTGGFDNATGIVTMTKDEATALANNIAKLLNPPTAAPALALTGGGKVETHPKKK